MADQVFYVEVGLDDVDGALEAALENNGIELSDEQFDAIIENLPSKIAFKIYFDDTDIDGSFDVLDEDWG